MKNNNIPSYLKWLFTEHKRGKIKVLLTLLGIIQIIWATPQIMEEYNGGYIPLLPVVLVHIAMYGFVIGMIYQPYNIYVKLKNLNFWGEIKTKIKK